MRIADPGTVLPHHRDFLLCGSADDICDLWPASQNHEQGLDLTLKESRARLESLEFRFARRQMSSGIHSPSTLVLQEIWEHEDGAIVRLDRRGGYWPHYILPTVTFGDKALTPWGRMEAQPTQLAPGVYSVCAQHHGGYWVHPAVRALWHPALQAVVPEIGATWWEEDHDWALVVLGWPEAFSAFRRERAAICLAANHPTIAAAIDTAPRPTAAALICALKTGAVPHFSSPDPVS